MNKDLKNALRSTRDMDEYLEVRSSQEIIDDIKASAGQETLRDQFAIAALPHALARERGLIDRYGDKAMQDHVPGAARLAYAIADAMLAERCKQSSAQGTSHD